MTRVDIFLVMLVVLSALGVVSAQHESRKLVTAYEHERETMQRLDVEWGQLQLEQSTWANHARVENVAREHLRMRVPDPSSILLVEPPR
ncbi:MAG: cell division protein FtsL [Rhodocyclaceae bacterium]|nr:cell division protein FtsL [Rhodocyclaceae bacterium]